jgi:CxxC motif-containing protein
MNERVMTCILCPNGCELRATWEGEPTEETLSVDGNLCPKGVSYAADELTNPMRTLTTSVRIRHGVQRLAGVKTASPLPRDRLAAVRAVLEPVVLEAPVAIGEIALPDAAGLGIDVVVTRAVARRSSEALP